MAARNVVLFFLMIFWLAVQSTVAQEDATIESTTLTDQIYMLTGHGGNLGVFIGQDGTFLIDDQFAPLTEKIIAELMVLGGDIPRFLINTHYHGDHTGGNENLGKAGTLTGNTELSGYLQMLETAYERLRKLEADGKTAQEAIEMKPLADLEKEWGDGIFNGDKWIEIIYPGV